MISLPRSCNRRGRGTVTSITLPCFSHRRRQERSGTVTDCALRPPGRRGFQRSASRKWYCLTGRHRHNRIQVAVHGVKWLRESQGSGRQCGIPQMWPSAAPSTLNTFNEDRGRVAERIYTAQRDVFGRTHYLPSCLVERVAIAVLYLLQINHLGLAGLARLS